MLTAAHCCAHTFTNKYVKLGGKRNIKVEVKEAKKHPQFSFKSMQYDICVATLDRDVMTDPRIKDYVEVVLLPNGQDCDDDHKIHMDATGWGYFKGCKISEASCISYSSSY